MENVKIRFTNEVSLIHHGDSNFGTPTIRHIARSYDEDRMDFINISEGVSNWIEHLDVEI